LFVLAAACALALCAAPAQASWLPSWSMAESGIGGVGESQNLRMLISPHRGGNWVRVELSNADGSSQLIVDSATVAKTAAPEGPTLKQSSLRQLRFGGRKVAVIGAGETALSDPVRLRVRAFEHLAVSIHLPRPQMPLEMHWTATQASYLSGAGAADLSSSADGAGFTKATDSWYLVSALEVKPHRQEPECGSVATLGDSITDGFGSTRSADHRYPDYLQRDLSGQRLAVSVVNAGASGNKLLTDSKFLAGPSAMHRLRRDVLSVPRLRAVIVFEGINDLATGSTAAQVKRADKRIIHRIHQRGAAVVLATLTPVGGHYYEDQAEPGRSKLNRWIRGQHLADAVVDFDRSVRDPADPLRLQTRYSSDGVHLSDAGYQRLASAAVPKLRSLLDCR
jgi:lysophospholipase L1-like esterase